MYSFSIFGLLSLGDGDGDAVGVGHVRPEQTTHI